MPLDNAAMTLADYAVLKNDPLTAGVVLSLHKLGSVLQDMKFKTTNTGVIRGARFTHSGLPTATFRKLNDSATTVRATPSSYMERSFILSNNIDVDDVMMRDQALGVNPQAAQLQAYLESVSRVINDYFINNDPITGDDDAPIGIRYRLDNPSEYGVSSDLKWNHGGVDLSPAGLTATTANNFIRQLDEHLHAMGSPEGDDIVIYMNETLAAAFPAALRVLGVGGWGFVPDAFGRMVTKFRNATVRALGRALDGTTKVIANTETAAGADGTSDFTSYYMVKYSPGYFEPWQQLPMEVTNFGQVSGQKYHRLNIQWPFGYMHSSLYSIGRGYNIKIK